MTAKKTAKSAAPQPSVQEIVNDAEAHVAGKPVRTLSFDDMAREKSLRLEQAAMIVNQAKQSLANAFDLYSEGEGKATEGDAIAANVAARLAEAEASGTIKKEDTSAILGDIFGYVGKGESKGKVVPAGHPDAGITPGGKGGHIRKRIVRLVEADKYVRSNGVDAGSFFGDVPVPVSDVELLMLQLSDGALTAWQVYDRLAELKREHSEKSNPAFDPKKVYSLADALSTDDALTAIAQSAALRDAYSELYQVLKSMNEHLPARIAELAEADENE